MTVELSPEVERWVAQKMASSGFASPTEFVNARLSQDCLEDAIEEAFQEPASELGRKDWDQLRQKLEQQIAQR